ncbi:MAG TPA: response regulator, partial [Burkholderiales bacterium]|nr:response regulator [Burkholderiales bacterium]
MAAPVEPKDRCDILIVDDLQEKLLVFKTILEELGQNLIMVRSGAEALREARSLERLMDAVYFSLHRSMRELSDGERQAIEGLHHDTRVLEGKKALIVDDDMRNIFALSTVLHDHGMETISANNGREAIRLVQEDQSIDIVLMDIMMPEMDGMTTMREIRKLEQRK